MTVRWTVIPPSVLHQQNVLTVDPQTGRPLGLSYQQYHRRRLRPPSLGNDRTEARHVPIEERGSYWWIEAIRSTGPPPDDGVELE